MNGVRLVLVWLFVYGALLAQQAPPITRAGFMKAVEIGGIEPDEFANIIRTRGVDFELTGEEKKRLAEAGVPGKVLDAVVASRKQEPAPTAAPAVVAPAAPAAPAGPRIETSKAVAVIVHKDNPLSNIDLTALRRIYTGLQTGWKNGRNIYVINRDPSSPARRVFYKKVLKSDPARVFALEGSSMMFKPSVQEPGGIVRGFVSRVQDAIGYVDFSEVDSSVKVLTVNGVSLTEETIANGTYPLLFEN